MAISKYIKKPIPVKATLLSNKTAGEIMQWMEHAFNDWFISEGSVKGILINTLEGTMKCEFGNYVVQGIHDEFWCVQKDIFEKTYERIIEIYIVGKNKQILKKAKNILKKIYNIENIDTTLYMLNFVTNEEFNNMEKETPFYITLINENEEEIFINNIKKILENFNFKKE